MIKKENLEFYAKVAYNLYSIRISKGFSQQELSNLSNVERGKISKIENRSEDFVFGTIIELAKALEVSPSQIFNFDVEVPTDFYLIKQGPGRKKATKS